MTIGFYENLFPEIIQGLCAKGLTRDLIANSLNGMLYATVIAATTITLLFAFRRKISAIVRRAGEQKVFSASLIALSVLSLPDPVFPMQAGLDYSWQWMLNRLAFTREWGSSIVFTYGPLGWLLYPSGRWATVALAIVSNLGYCLLWIWSLRKIHDESENGRFVAWGLLLTMFFPQMSMEWRWVVLSIVLTRVSWLAAGIVSAFLGMMKFSSIITAMGSQMVLLILDKNRRLPAYVFGFTLTFVLLAAISFSSPASFLMWLNGSMQITTGYNQHMLMDKGMFELLVPVLAFLIVVHTPRMFFAAFSLAPLLYCSAKYAWVRQGFLPFLYVCTVLAAFLMERFVSSRRRLFVTSALFVLIAFAFTWPWHFASGKTYVAFPYGLNPMGLIKTLTVPRSMVVATSRTKELLCGFGLPDVIRDIIGDNKVQIFGHEFAPAMIDNTIRIVPYATMQLYSTYTAMLDEMAARSYFTSNAPPFVLIDTKNISIDAKNPFLDSPRTWAALRSNYALCHATDDGRWVLLERRLSPVEISMDKTVVCPEITIMEKMMALAFRGRFHFADIKTANGTKRTFRVNPSVLGSPIDPDMPLDVRGIVEYFK